MNLTEEQKSIVVSAGEYELSNEALAFKLGINEDTLIRLMKDPHSQVCKYYEIGKETKMFDVYEGLKKQVLEGKTYAAKIMDDIRRNHEADKLKKKLFGI